MAGRLRSIIGALLLVSGIAIAAVGFIASPAAAADNEVQICNNQSGDTTKDCVGDKDHGTASWVYDGDDLVFTITGNQGFGGWRQIYICIPGTDKTQSADCQGNTASVLSPADGDYTVAGVTNPVVADRDVSFDCDTNFTARVAGAVLANAGSPVSWTIHVNTCDGGTDEAFGSSAPSGPTTNAATYACDTPDVTATSATLKGSTTDSAVDGAEFTLTGQLPVAGTKGTGNAYSAEVSGLTKNTLYKYTITFKAGTDVVKTTTECEFATLDVAAVEASAHNPTSEAVVLGVAVTRPTAAAVAPAAAAAAPVAIAATGPSDVSMSLLVTGVLLVGLGTLLVVAARRKPAAASAIG